MKYERYEIFSGIEIGLFEFVSTGKKGSITKFVQYSVIGLEDVYNLAFGDKKWNENDFEDDVIADNGDSEKVLRTVTIYAFTNEHPVVIIFIKGNSVAKTRLYQMGITKFIEEINIDFYLYGEKDDE